MRNLDDFSPQNPLNCVLENTVHPLSPVPFLFTSANPTTQCAETTSCTSRRATPLVKMPATARGPLGASASALWNRGFVQWLFDGRNFTSQVRFLTSSRPGLR